MTIVINVDDDDDSKLNVLHHLFTINCKQSASLVDDDDDDEQFRGQII